MFFNKFIHGLRSYVVSTHKAWEIEDKSKVLKLDWNESTISPSPLVRKALLEFADNGLMNWYPDVNNKKLRGELSSYSQVDVDYIDYFASSDALHEYIIRAFINPGDHITMIAPTYDNFRAAAESIGAKVDYFWLDEKNQFKFDFSRFEEYVEENRPKIVYLCNPNNPTGTIYSTELIEQLVRRFNDVLFIIDEAYFEFVGCSASPLVANYENIIICRTFSKAFGLASFRVGYAIASKHNMEGLRKLRNPKNISSYAQIAATAALADVNYMQEYVDEVLEAKKVFTESLLSLGIEVIGSQGGNFVLVKFGEQQKQVMSHLENNQIFVRNYGHVNGMSDYTRITIGTRQQMDFVFETIRSSL
ncbi:aminotransferase [Pseudoalteromonas rubra]|uniref:histidinol-phosphate transaminase n=1 Tax=Pseudoalteromonas rubra TaxID=43658 RepID=A0A0L0ET36_9GAMM|nr:aminotransferase [Pseudoalteromonas rubra]